MKLNVVEFEDRTAYTTEDNNLRMDIEVNGKPPSSVFALEASQEEATEFVEKAPERSEKERTRKLRGFTFEKSDIVEPSESNTTRKNRVP